MLYEFDQGIARYSLGLIRAPFEHVEQGREDFALEHHVAELIYI